MVIGVNKFVLTSRARLRGRPEQYVSFRYRWEIPLWNNILKKIAYTTD